MRRYYLDNLRYGIVLVVVVYHVVYIFNSVGVISNILVPGIPQMDGFLYFTYPWLMPSLFLVSGIGARYALQKRTAKQFLQERATKLLIPAVAGMFILGWVTGYVTALSTDIFAGNGANVPGIVKYLIYSLIGTGPLWFAQELFLASLVLVMLRAIDQADRLWKFSKNANMIVILLLFFAVWGSSHLFNTPVIEVYRHGIYIFMFLLGYYLFSHDQLQATLEKWHLPLLIAAIICGVVYTVYYYGQNYTSAGCLQSPFTNLYLWLMTLALLGCGKAWFNGNTPFTRYMAPRSFGIYVLHYPLLILFTYWLTTGWALPKLANYGVLLLVALTVVPLAYEVVSRIPIIRFLLLGKAYYRSA